MATAPTAFIAKVEGITAVRLTWVNGAGNALYRIRRSLDTIFANSVEIGTAPQLVGTPPAPQQEFEDLAGPAGTVFNYWIIAEDAGGGQATEVGPVAVTTFSNDINIFELYSAFMDLPALAIPGKFLSKQVIPERDRGIKPKKPLMTVNILGPRKIGHDDNLQSNGDISYRYKTR